ncbi:Transcriptional regulator, LysR family [Nitrincola lacisaponensis]|uniref:Transcriptional regulator, LysR family n=1 Tax=Nitrincola lacisaponensis TaxID=267850 RepID=A0A063XYF4_9GAMM|nr:LysR substrate-binding domain-containing protein [Nitrincola lacisaponensis]KDE38519.1 Transcriptional regulator, LysR family [Nitrincola lacisaponensis]
MDKKINYKHLHYFRTIAREGSITAASDVLKLAPQTLSGQLTQLESDFGRLLFRREGRKLHLTSFGQQVFDYTDAMFSIADELAHFISTDELIERNIFRVGVSSSIHKLIVYNLIQPAYQHTPSLHLICKTGETERQLNELRTHRLDLLITDRLKVIEDITSFQIKEVLSSGISLFAAPKIARKLREKGLPDSLQGSLLLANARNAVYFERLIAWLAKRNIHMRIAAEIDDSALIKIFGSHGMGVFAAPTMIADEVCRQYQVETLLEIDSVQDKIYAVYNDISSASPWITQICQQTYQ